MSPVGRENTRGQPIDYHRVEGDDIGAGSIDIGAGPIIITIFLIVVIATLMYFVFF